MLLTLAAMLVMVGANTLISLGIMLGKTKELSDECDKISAGDLTVEFKKEEGAFGEITGAVNKTVKGIQGHCKKSERVH